MEELETPLDDEPEPAPLDVPGLESPSLEDVGRETPPLEAPLNEEVPGRDAPPLDTPLDTLGPL